MTVFLVVATLLSLAIGGVALFVAVRALKNDEGTAAETRKLATDANDVQTRVLAIEEARRREELAPDFVLTYEPVHPDPNYPECGQLLLSYEGSTPCEQLVIEELRGPLWANAVREVVRWETHADSAGNRTDVHRYLRPGDVRPFIVRLEMNGEFGEIRFLLTATVDGHEYPPVIKSCTTEPPAQDFAMVVNPNDVD